MDYIISVGGRIGNDYMNMVRIYHVQGDTWTIKNNFPYAIYLGIGYSLGKSRFFVHGGKAQDQATEEVEKSITEYDFENDAWIQGFRLNTVNMEGFAVAYNK